jgi:Flp pilus assembly protein TadG
MIRLEGGTMKAERGQSVLEFALVLPFFLIILFALFEFGRGMVEYTSLSNAAREGARSGIVPTKPLADITNAARAATVTVGTLPAVEIIAFRGGVALADATNRQSGDTVQVRVSHTFVPIFWVSRGYQPAGIGGLGLSIPMSSIARMRVE